MTIMMINILILSCHMTKMIFLINPFFSLSLFFPRNETEESLILLLLEEAMVRVT